MSGVVWNPERPNPAQHKGEIKMDKVFKPDEYFTGRDITAKKVIVEAIKPLLISGVGSLKKKMVPSGTVVELTESEATRLIKHGKAKLSHKKETKVKELVKMQGKYRAKKSKELKQRVEKIRNENS